MNMWLIGIWVLLIHDVSDFWLILGRGYVVRYLFISGLQA
jgi:hypothetical protein